MDIRSKQQHLAPSTILGKPQSNPCNNPDEWLSIGFKYTAGDETATLYIGRTIAGARAGWVTGGRREDMEFSEGNGI